MPDVLDPLSASEIYSLALEPRPGGRWQRWVFGALDLWCATIGGRFELTASGDVVVRRRADDVEELRVETYSPDDAAETLTRIRRQLDELEPEEFRAHWSID